MKLLCLQLNVKMINSKSVSPSIKWVQSQPQGLQLLVCLYSHVRVLERGRCRVEREPGGRLHRRVGEIQLQSFTFTCRDAETQIQIPTTRRTRHRQSVLPRHACSATLESKSHATVRANMWHRGDSKLQLFPSTDRLYLKLFSRSEEAQNAFWTQAKCPDAQSFPGLRSCTGSF